MNLVGDFGGGAMYLVPGVLAAMLEAEATGRGQVIDAAIVDGTAHLLTHVHTVLASGTDPPHNVVFRKRLGTHVEHAGRLSKSLVSFF
jgi:crotonobetainyl-CoA:carnitine CoA-transferase CaiB-like acyl-CoA transferase